VGTHSNASLHACSKIFSKALKNIQEAIGLYLEADEDLKDLREAKEELKNEEGVPLDKVIKVLKLR
jgi:predicted RNase H-like HicB family nuclease